MLFAYLDDVVHQLLAHSEPFSTDSIRSELLMTLGFERSPSGFNRQDYIPRQARHSALHICGCSDFDSVAELQIVHNIHEVSLGGDFVKPVRLLKLLPLGFVPVADYQDVACEDASEFLTAVSFAAHLAKEFIFISVADDGFVAVDARVSGAV